MLKVKNVTIGTEKYGPGYECNVTFQVGDASYNTVPVKLPPEATREIIEMAVQRAAAVLTVIPTEIKIAGEERLLPLIEAAPAPVSDPEFAEVDEAPRAAPAAEMETF